MDKIEEEDIYNSVGPLSRCDFDTLEEMYDDKVRRRTLYNWYGRKGARHAWKVWLKYTMRKR